MKAVFADTFYFDLRRTGVLALFLGLASASIGHAQLVSVWNDLTLTAIRHANIPPPVAVRQMAMVHLETNKFA